MRQILFYIFLIGLTSCWTNSQGKKIIGQGTVNESENEASTNESKSDYLEIVLSENALDTFLIPFPEKDMLMSLKNFYGPYWVEANIGQQDGPDFTYIEIKRDDNNPVAYLDFDSANKYKLDEIRIVDSSAKDQYEIRVGDTYQQVIETRREAFKNSTNYHQHTYLYSDNSNIYYELSGDYTLTEEMLDSIEELELTEQQLQKCTVKCIIWRKRN